jgi:hypothetical protein
MYISEGAIPQKKTEGKTIILGALWGLGLLLGAYVILRTVNPELVTLDVGELDQAHFENVCTSSSTVVYVGGKRIVKNLPKCGDFEWPRDETGVCSCYTDKQWVETFGEFSTRVENEANPYTDEVVSGTIGSQGQSCFDREFGSSNKAVQEKLVNISCMGLTLRVHEKAKAAYETACAKIPASVTISCGEKPINSGTQNWRGIAGSGSRSLHSYGIAVDFSAWRCGYCDNVRRKDCYAYSSKKICSPPPAQGQCTTPNLPASIINAFKSTEGFRWGGDYKSKTDNMHFEWLGPCAS